MIKTFIVRRDGHPIDEFISTVDSEEDALAHWWRGLCPKALKQGHVVAATGDATIEVRCE